MQLLQLPEILLKIFRETFYIKDAVYQNPKATYAFDEVTISSNFDADKLRTITINSDDVVNGKIVGKFQFAQLDKLVMNSVGSLIYQLQTL